MNSDSLPGTAASSSPAGSPLRTNVYGFSQVPYTRIPHMLLDKVMEVGVALCMQYYGWLLRMCCTTCMCGWHVCQLPGAAACLPAFLTVTVLF